MESRSTRPHRNGEAFCPCQLFGLNCWLAHGVVGPSTSCPSIHIPHACNLKLSFAWINWL
jgi:hypothetical protein